MDRYDLSTRTPIEVRVEEVTEAGITPVYWCSDVENAWNDVWIIADWKTLNPIRVVEIRDGNYYDHPICGSLLESNDGKWLALPPSEADDGYAEYNNSYDSDQTITESDCPSGWDDCPPPCGGSATSVASHTKTLVGDMVSISGTWITTTTAENQPYIEDGFDNYHSWISEYSSRVEGIFLAKDLRYAQFNAWSTWIPYATYNEAINWSKENDL